MGRTAVNSGAVDSDDFGLATPSELSSIVTKSKNMAYKIAVLGSNSFSGASFVDACLTRGATVVGISRSAEPIPAFLPYKTNRAIGQFRFHALDINRNLPEIFDVLDAFKPDYVVNYAAQSMVGESWQHPEHWFQTNCVGQVKFHDRLRQRPYLKKYVHISTPEVYGSCSGNVTEDAPFNPSTPYAVSRAACDMSLMSFLKQYRFPVVFTRAANVYGPGQQLYRIIPRAILYAKLGKKLPLHGGGHSVRSFIHISDVNDGTWKVMERAEPGECYHLSTPEQVSIREVVSRIAARMGVPFESLVDIVDERPGKDAAYLLDSGRARARLSWKDTITLNDGIQETIKWVDENFEALKREPLNYIHKE